MSSNTSCKLAIMGGSPVRGPEKAWPSWPQFDDAERKAVNEVLESGAWWHGERVQAFEQDYAAFQDARYGVSACSGTACLEIALQALGIGAGDEVIVPPFTFIATASAVARVGAAPVFVDVDETWNLDPALIEDAITERTKAIIPVHFAGRVCDMDRIGEIAEGRGLHLLEDACHSWGSKWKGKGTGALGLGGVFSFQMSKNITAAEGGIIVTDDEDFAERCRSISNCGRARDGQWYGHARIGTNARMTEFQAAILNAQLGRLEEQTVRREKHAALLDAALSPLEGLTPQPGDSRITRRAYHLYCLRLDEDAFGCSRERLCEAAQAEGLPLGPGYTVPLYKQPAIANLKGGPDYAACRCPMTEDLCYRSGMWLHHKLLLAGPQDMQDIIDILLKLKEHVGELSD